VAEENGGKNGTKRRDPETGRFLPCNGGGPGRPPGSSTADFKAAIRGATTTRDLVDIWNKAKDQAKKGNDPARRFIFGTLGLIEILVDVTSGGEKIDTISDATIADAIRVLGSPNGCQGCGS
jgi:hypothetical protein